MQKYSIDLIRAGQEEIQEVQRQKTDRRCDYRWLLRNHPRRVLTSKANRFHNKRLEQAQQLLRADHAGPVHLRREGHAQPHLDELHQCDIGQPQPAAVDGRRHLDEVRLHLRELLPQ